MKQERPPQIEVRGSAPDRLMQIVLWKRSPSLNEWNYKHWRAYHKIKTEWRDRLALVLNGKINFHKAHLLFCRFATRELDKTNAEGGIKPIEDALVYFNLLADDSMRCADRYVEQTKVQKRIEERTVIIVQELDR